MSHRRTALGLLAALSLLPGGAFAWWNDEWAARKAVRVDLSASGANFTQAVGPAAVLIRLHAGNFRFEQAKEDGSDVRFVAADDKTPLAFHFERYDPLLGEALAWVAIPDLKPGARYEAWLYYKNPKAPAAEDAKSTWDKDVAGVWHFSERGAPPRDFTAWANHGSSSGGAADGALIGRGLKLDGGAPVTIPAGPSLGWAPGAAMTLTVWVKPTDAESSAVILARREGDRSFLLGLDAGKPFVEVNAGAGPQRVASAGALTAGGWHQLAVVAGQSLAIWLDGAQSASSALKLPALKSPLLIGADDHKPEEVKKPGEPAAPAPLPGFKGELDELQLSKVERPAGWLQLAFASQGTDPGRLIAFGQDEEGSGLASGYFAVILRSVTPDGWVVIALLGVMLVISWVVMVNKASLLSSVEKANDRFSERFHHASSDLVKLVLHQNGVALDEARVLEQATLHRLFQVAAEEVRKRVATHRALSTHAIESIRASLDATLVREGQRLSKNMVLLTIAISGGPFLGLLGTVVGVMITFAAIAAAGDVNVNAIAPGIAAALVATVAGLGVAIPALFGYNWLLTRVKNVSANQQVFADELITRLAEAFAAREEQQHPSPHAGPLPPPPPPPDDEELAQ